MYKGHVEHTMNKILFTFLLLVMIVGCDRQESGRSDGDNMQVLMIRENKFVGINQAYAEYLFGELDFGCETNGVDTFSVRCEVNGTVFLLDFKRDNGELYICHDVQYPLDMQL